MPDGAGRRLTGVAVAHTGITCSDLERAIGFYRDVLGLEVTDPVRVGGRRMEQITGMPGAVIDVAYVNAPGHRIELLCYVEPTGAPSLLRPCDPGFVHVALEVEHLDEAARALLRAGYEAVHPVESLEPPPPGGMRGVYTRDPDRVVIELIETARRDELGPPGRRSQRPSG